jgi:prophage maintenance system killer protein
MNITKLIVNLVEVMVISINAFSAKLKTKVDHKVERALHQSKFHNKKFKIEYEGHNNDSMC